MEEVERNWPYEVDLDFVITPYVTWESGVITGTVDGRAEA